MRRLLIAVAAFSPYCCPAADITTTAVFTTPATGGSVSVSVVSDNGLAVDDAIFISGAGYYRISEIYSATLMKILNLGALGNVSSGSSIAAGAQVNATTVPGPGAFLEFHHATSGQSPSINFLDGPRQNMTLTASTVTIQFATTSAYPFLRLRLLQDSTGSRIPVIPQCMWQGGIPPTFSTTPNAIDLVAVDFDGKNYFCDAGIGYK